jgi:hypothetical protein
VIEDVPALLKGASSKLGLEKKLGLGEPARARCGSGRLESARELPASRAGFASSKKS